MGNEETKPVYPTEDQWKIWQQEKKKYINEEIAKSTNIYSKELEEQMSKTFISFTNYFNKCHDKSRISRFFIDNNECSRAREQLMMDIFKYSEKKEVIDRVKATKLKL